MNQGFDAADTDAIYVYYRRAIDQAGQYDMVWCADGMVCTRYVLILQWLLIAIKGKCMYTARRAESGDTLKFP